MKKALKTIFAINYFIVALLFANSGEMLIVTSLLYFASYPVITFLDNIK